MKNPIQVFEKIKDNFILYVETAFSSRYESFESQRKELLNKDKIFARSPWVEPLPIYEPSEFKIKDIKHVHNLDETELQIFKEIVNAGLVGDFKIYQHQYQMLQKAMKGQHCVITSGTGSGKTESFLLPLFAYLSKEMSKWRRTENTVNNRTWWIPLPGVRTTMLRRGTRRMNTETRQRPSENRPAALRALLLYPMNALVEDQLSRLRKALDSEDARSLFRGKYNDNRIYFGRYNSTSPVSGKLYKINQDNGSFVSNTYVIQKLKKELRAIEENNRDLELFINNEEDNFHQWLENNPEKLSPEELKKAAKEFNEGIKDLIANFQRLDGAEMRTRFDMQETPPDILITNFSMLSIMLMRHIEDPIFEKTKDWLECNTEFDKELTLEQREQEKKDRIFHLIIDELHLYRGGPGSEIAFIIRLFLARIGLTPDSDQLRILASSASLEGEEGKAFLKSFFGTEKREIEIIEGVEERPNTSAHPPLVELVKVIETLGRNSHKIEIDLNDRLGKQKATINEVDSVINDELSGNYHLVNFIIENEESLKSALYNAFEVYENDGNSRIRAVPAFKNGKEDDTSGVKFISEVLFGEHQTENKDAVKGFFFLGVAPF
jgi:DEAD/DEAH box helicase domain-containing protein